MPIELLRDRLTQESKVVPFTVFSVMVFWSITIAVCTSALWIYPKLEEAGETKVQLQNFRTEFTHYRLEDRIDNLSTEELRMRREMERLRASGATVPDIYEDQLTRIMSERALMQKKLDALIAASVPVKEAR